MSTQTETPTPAQAADLAIRIFRTQSVARPWVTFHLVLLDASFWPPSADSAVLAAAITKFGIAGTIGIDRICDTEGERIISRWAETPEALRALARAADVLNPAALVAPAAGLGVIN